MARPVLLCLVSLLALLLALRGSPRQPQAFSTRIFGFLRRTAGRGGSGPAAMPQPQRLPRGATAEKGMKERVDILQQRLDQQEISLANGATIPNDVLDTIPRSKAKADAPEKAEKAKEAKEAFRAEVKSASTAARSAAPSSRKTEAQGVAAPAEDQSLAAGLREIAAEAETLDMSEDLVERFSARAKKTVFNTGASWLEAAPWAPFAFLGAVLVAGGVFVASSLNSPAPVQVPAAKPSPAPIVVQLQQPVAPAPPVAPKPVAPVVVAPVAPAAVAPKPAAPVAVAPAKPATPLPKPAAAAPAASQPAAAASETNWGRRFANFLAGGLRKTADMLPAAELELEKDMPVVENGVKWALEIRPENAQSKLGEAAPVVGKAAARSAEVVARTGLQLSSDGLEFVSEELPGAGQALQGAVVKALPSIQAGTRAVADGARGAADRAGELAKPGALPSKIPKEFSQVLGEVEPLLDTSAAALDVAADVTPSAEALAAYTAGKALPIARAALTAFSEITSDAANMPMPEKLPLPEAAQVKSTLKAFGFDTDQAAAAVQAQAQLAWNQAASKLPDPNKALDQALRNLLGEPGTPGGVKVAAPAAAPAAPKAAAAATAPAPAAPKAQPQAAVAPAPAAAAPKASSAAPAPAPAPSVAAPAATKAAAPSAPPVAMAAAP